VCNFGEEKKIAFLLELQRENENSISFIFDLFSLRAKWVEEKTISNFHKKMIANSRFDDLEMQLIKDTKFSLEEKFEENENETK
jgi:hypothetical protein